MDPFTSYRLAVATQFERRQEADQHAPRRGDERRRGPAPSRTRPQPTLRGWRGLFIRLSPRTSD
jgi:hypothetical protein